MFDSFLALLLSVAKIRSFDVKIEVESNFMMIYTNCSVSEQIEFSSRQ